MSLTIEGKTNKKQSMQYEFNTTQKSLISRIFPIASNFLKRRCAYVQNVHNQSGRHLCQGRLFWLGSPSSTLRPGLRRREFHIIIMPTITISECVLKDKYYLKYSLT